MKNLVWVTALLILMTVGIICCDAAMNKKVDDMLELCDRINSSHDIDDISNAVNELNDKWYKFREKLFMALHHSDIDSVDYAVTKLNYALKAEKIESIYDAVDSLIYYLDDLLDTEVFGITNIL